MVNSNCIKISPPKQDAIPQQAAPNNADTLLCLAEAADLIRTAAEQLANLARIAAAQEKASKQQ